MKKDEVESKLESLCPLLYHCGLIRFNQNGKIETELGSYLPEGDLNDAIERAISDLEVELPNVVILKVNAGKIKVMRKDRTAKDESVLFHPILECNLNSEDESLLQRIITAQGGRFKQFGYFRFDLSLAKQNLFNCDNCGEIWKSARSHPLRCPVCRHPQPPQPPQPQSEKFRPSKFQLREEGILYSLNKNDGMNLNIAKNRNMEITTMEIRLPRIESFDRIRREGRSLEESLFELLKSYDSEYLNMIRSPSENDKIIDLLKSAEDSLYHILSGDNPELIWWTDSTRPIGNWPYTPWLSFGIADTMERIDRYQSLRGDITINCMIMLDAHSKYAILVIVPNVKELIKNYGQRWSLEYRPIKEEMRTKISWIIGEGFHLDDEANYWTIPYSTGDKMRSALVAYRYFNMQDLWENKLQESLKVMMRAYRELLD